MNDLSENNMDSSSRATMLHIRALWGGIGRCVVGGGGGALHKIKSMIHRERSNLQIKIKGVPLAQT